MVAGSVRERTRDRAREWEGESRSTFTREAETFIRFIWPGTARTRSARRSLFPFFFSSFTGYNFLLSRKRASARFQFPSWFAESHYPSFLPSPTRSPCIIYRVRCRTVIKTRRKGEKRKEKERDCCTMNSRATLTSGSSFFLFFLFSFYRKSLLTRTCARGRDKFIRILEV